MNKKILLFIFLASGSLWAQYSVTSTHFTPIQLSEEYPLRITSSMNMASGPNLELELGLLYHLGTAFDVGLGLHGGIMDSSVSSVEGALGFDLMLRFLTNLSESSFGGLQTQFGYAYMGLGNSDVTLNDASAFPITLGLILGGTVQEVTKLYIFPAVELGQTRRVGDSLWKSGVGLRITFGTTVELSTGRYLLIEARPKIADFDSNPSFKTFSTDVGLGFLFDF